MKVPELLWFPFLGDADSAFLEVARLEWSARELPHWLAVLGNRDMQGVPSLRRETVEPGMERDFSVSNRWFDLHVRDAGRPWHAGKIDIAAQAAPAHRASDRFRRVGVGVGEHHSLEGQGDHQETEQVLAAGRARRGKIHLARWEARFPDLLAIDVDGGERVQILHAENDAPPG